MRNKIAEILRKRFMSASDTRGHCSQAADQIISLILSELPEEHLGLGGRPVDNNDIGYNKCLSDVRKKLSRC
jgi:hypothetical protein